MYKFPLKYFSSPMKISILKVDFLLELHKSETCFYTSAYGRRQITPIWAVYAIELTGRYSFPRLSVPSITNKYTTGAKERSVGTGHLAVFRSVRSSTTGGDSCNDKNTSSVTSLVWGNVLKNNDILPGVFRRDISKVIG